MEMRFRQSRIAMPGDFVCRDRSIAIELCSAYALRQNDPIAYLFAKYNNPVSHKHLGRNYMQKTKDMPLWVFLAFSSIETRKGALMLIWSSIIFSFYCVPWSHYFNGNYWISKVFLLDDWEWFAMMLPITLWYWLSMRWLDKNGGWNQVAVLQENSQI